MTQLDFSTTLDPDLYFQGLARQELDFHAALGELLDNAFSARHPVQFGEGVQNMTVELSIEQQNAGHVVVQVADHGIGIPLADITTHIFNLGGQGATKGQLNEHGFGLKNALALLTGGNATTFTLLTRSTTDGLGPDQFLRVEGPLSTAMSVRDDATREDWTRDLHLLEDAETGTKLRIEVPWKYFRTVYRRGTPGLDILAARWGNTWASCTATSSKTATTSDFRIAV